MKNDEIKQLLPIKQYHGQNAVNARMLHDFLGSKRDFSNWIKHRIEHYDFIENQDYEVFNKIGENLQGGRPQIEYALSLDMAKELCMIENSERGKQARRYFIKCEKELREQFQNPYSIPKTYAEALRLAAEQQEKLERQERLLLEQKPKVEFFDTVAESKTAMEMKEVANALNFHKVGRNTLFQILRDNKLLTHKNQPYQRYIDCGFFRTIEQEWQYPSGETRISIKTLVYQSGVDYIRKLLLKLGYKPNPKENRQ